MITIIERREEREKTQPKLSRHSTIAPPSPALWCPATVPEQQLAPCGHMPPVHTVGVVLCGVEYAFGQFGSPAPAMLLPSFLCTSSLAEHDSQKAPWLRSSTAQPQPNHLCVTNIIPYWTQNCTSFWEENEFSRMEFSWLEWIPAQTRTRLQYTRAAGSLEFLCLVWMLPLCVP